MNLEYLKKDVIPQRLAEIARGENAATRQPIYFIYDLVECYASGHNEYSPITNEINKQQEHGYLDAAKDSECQVFKKTDYRMKKPEEVTRFWVDRYVAFFFTRQAAKEYILYQKHNLSKLAYIYVQYTGYANHHMDAIFENDKPQ
jgi:hypothetical protein